MIGRIVAAILIASFALVAVPLGGSISASAEPRGWDRGRGRGWGSARGRGRGGNGGGWGWGKPSHGAPEAFWGGVIGGWLGQALRPDRQAQDVEGEFSPGSDEWLDYCTKRYKSFNPETGTYRTYQGEDKPCRYYE